MAYDEVLAGRIREAVRGEEGVTEKRMFGGLAFLVHGHLAVAAGRDALMVRIDPAAAGSLTADPRVRRVEMRGRAMDGWLHVDVEALENDDDLRRWLDTGLGHARSLPAT